MSPRQCYAATLAVSMVSLVVSGCPGGDREPSNADAGCIDGKVRSCPCSDGTEGIQTCQSDGTWDACKCGNGNGDAGPSNSDAAPTDTGPDRSDVDSRDTEISMDDASDTGESTNYGRPEPVLGTDVLSEPYEPTTIRTSAKRPVDPPDCDSSNSAVQILEEGDDLQAALNRSDKRIFCIRPGDYRGTDVTISGTSGSEQKRRWLRFHSPGTDETTHPWHMADPEKVAGSNRALLGDLDMKGASHWVFDRLRFHGNVNVLDGSNANIFNRLMFYRVPHRDTYGNVMIRFENADRNTIQESLLARPGADFQNGSAPDTIGVMVKDAHNTRIVDNEMFDFFSGDGVQTGQKDAQARGLIIQNNDIYRSQGYGEPIENGIDLKAGPAHTENGSVANLAPEDYAIVEHNRLWGDGVNMIYHWPSVSGVIIRDNIMWETGKFAYVVHKKDRINNDHHVYDNVLVDTGGGFKVRHTDDSFYLRNIFQTATGNDSTWSMYPAENNTISKNVFVDSDVGGDTDDHRVEDNAYYGSSTFGGASPAYDRGDPSDANHGELTVDIKQITDPDATRTLSGAKPTGSSPHAAWFDVD